MAEGQEAMVIPKKKMATAIFLEVTAGAIVGLEQIGLEMIDSQRQTQGNLKDALQWEAAQNFVPFVQGGLAVVMAAVTKNKTIRKIGSLLIAPSATMAAYRGGKFLPARLSVTATRMSNNRSIASARQNNAGKPTNMPGRGALAWTPTGLQA